MRGKPSQEAMAGYFKRMRRRAKCVDVIKDDDMVLLPVQNLPINNHAQIACHLDSVYAVGFDITKVCVMDQSASRIAEIWSAYKEEICLSGPEASKLKGIITAIDKLMLRLQNAEELATHHEKATEFHEKIKTKGSITQHLMVALLPSRRSEGLFNFCYHYVEADKGTTPEQLTAHLINNNTIGYDQKDKAWRYIMAGGGGDQSKRVRSTEGPEGVTSSRRQAFEIEYSESSALDVIPRQDDRNSLEGVRDFSLVWSLALCP